MYMYNHPQKSRFEIVETAVDAVVHVAQIVVMAVMHTKESTDAGDKVNATVITIIT